MQRSPAISSPGDRFEREADQVADRVLRMADVEVSPQGGDSDTILRQANGRPDGLWSAEELRRDQEEEEEARRHPVQLERTGGTPRMATDIAGRLARSDGGQPLGEETRAFMEPRFGHSFADVRVHTDSDAASLCNDLSARAFTYGKDVYFAAGSFDPEGADGRRLIAHELTHVVQQRPSGAEIHRACQEFPSHSSPDTYCETQAEATALTTRACPPDDGDFLYQDGPEGFRWRRIPGYGCAHYVAHRLGITKGKRWENCLGGFSVTIDQITAGRTPIPLARVRENDIWSSGIHSGVVIGVNRDAAGQVISATINQCNTRGGVAPIEGTASFFR